MPTIEMKTELPGPKSRAIIERKERVVCDPLDLHVNAVIDHGFGAAVTDVDGNTMLDLSSGLGCLLVGHSHPKVVEAVQRQAAKFSHTDFSVVPYEIYVELRRAARRARRAGPEGGAVQLGGRGRGERRQVREGGDGPARRDLLRGGVPRSDAAHHEPDQPAHAVQAGVRAVRGGGLPGAVQLPVPRRRSERPARRWRTSSERFTTVVDPRSVAAVIFEPVLGEGGYVVPGPEFLPGVEALCRQHGIVTIADEIQSGFGRTGKFLASEHFGLDPDIVILAKALAAGLSALRRGRPDRDHGRPRPVGDRRHVRRATPSRAPPRSRCST